MFKVCCESLYASSDRSRRRVGLLLRRASKCLLSHVRPHSYSNANAISGFVFAFSPLPLLFSDTNLFLGMIDYSYFLSRLFGNTIWCVATFYYIYITFLGYTGLFRIKKRAENTKLRCLQPCRFFKKRTYSCIRLRLYSFSMLRQ